MTHFYVPRILINGGVHLISYMPNVFDKLDLKKDKLLSNTGTNLQAFNNLVTCSRGFIELMEIFIEGIDTIMVDVQLLVVPCKNVYNFILGRSFSTTLDIADSTVHQKMKYHNVHDEPMTI